jgi:hypothetical protein
MGLGNDVNTHLESLRALKQCNMLVRQLPNLAKQYRLWLRIVRNLRLIEGSWTGAARRLMIMFQGRPRQKKHFW